MNILLVDDEKDLLDTMGEILEVCHNHKVQCAGSGKEALKWLRKNKYDLVIMDLRLPVMNGLEVIARTRKLLPVLPIVALTGIPSSEKLTEQLKKYDVEKIFAKPKGIPELLLYLKELKSKESVA